jgi:hypothetical protein
MLVVGWINHWLWEITYFSELHDSPSNREDMIVRCTWKAHSDNHQRFDRVERPTTGTTTKSRKWNQGVNLYLLEGKGATPGGLCRTANMRTM